MSTGARSVSPGNHGLSAYLSLVRLRAEAALLRRLNAGYGFADARLASEVYLRADSARERLGRGSLKPEDTHAEQAREVHAAIEEAVAGAEAAARAGESRLELACTRLGLGEAERALLMATVAYALDADVRELCHVLGQAMAGRRRAALYADVCQELMPELADMRALLAALHPRGALRSGRVIEVGLSAPGEAALAAAVSVRRSVVDWILGDERMSGPLYTAMRMAGPGDDLAVYVPEPIAAAVARIAGALGAGGRGLAGAPCVHVLVQGPAGAGKCGVAKRLADALERPLAMLDTARLLQLASQRGSAEPLAEALCEARLRGAVAYLPGLEALAASAEAAEIMELLAGHEDVLVIGSRERGAPAWPLARPFHFIRMPALRVEVREQAWQHSLGALAAAPLLGGEGAVAELAARYVLGPGAIGEVVSEARAFAAAAGAAPSRQLIEEAVGRRLSLRLGTFGTVITRRARVEEMVLPEDVVEALRDMIAMVEKRTQILERWGYGDHLGLHRGVAALFSGESGTGKTMAASVISSALGLELIRIDLAAITSKWVGETEKHLAKIFDEAQNANAMLLFDEADSLFGKRTELKSAQDRYANLEVNYVLQRMETFDGVSVLTTNAESAIDPAFLRRLNFRVRFPEPEVDERLLLWKRLLPPDTGIADRVNFRTLAERFVMTGGHIRNAIVRAAVIAAREGRPMEPEDLLRGAYLEYGEMGKVMPSFLR